MSEHRNVVFRPKELLLISAVLAIFSAGIVLLITRQPSLMILFGGAAFLVSIVLLALLGFVLQADTVGDRGGAAERRS